MKYAIFTINSRLTPHEITPAFNITQGISTGKLALIPSGGYLASIKIYKEVISRIPREIRQLMLHGSIPDQLLESECAEAFAAIPKTVTSLHLGYDFDGPLYDRRAKYLYDHCLKMIKTVPSHISAVGFHNLQVEPGNQLAFTTLLTAIPEHIKSLSLIDLHLIRMGKEELEQVFSKIPPHIKSIELAFNSRSYPHSNEMVIHAFNAIPSHVTTLKFSTKGIMAINELIELLTQVPPRITALDLSGYGLSDRSEDDLNQLFAAIPASITTLNLSDTVGITPYQRFHIRALASIPPHVKNIILDNHAFGHYPTHNYLIDMVRTLPAEIKMLDLSTYNPRGDIIEVFSAIPHHINSLYVSSDMLLLTESEPYLEPYLYHPRPQSQISAILKAIPNYITTLRIGCDSKGRFLAGFVDYIKELPSHVTTLDLSNNQLGDLSIEELVSLIKAIPLTVKHIVLRDNYLFHGKSTKEIDTILKALQPFSSNGRLDISFNGDSEFGRIAATSLINAAPQLPTDIWNHIIGTYLLPDTVEKPTQKIKSAQCQVFLNELQFEQYLDKFRAKRDLIKNKPGYEKAITAFNALITQLEARKDNFIKQNNSSREAKKQFKVDCLSDIAKAKVVLVQHRGWKKFFADLLSVFCSVLSAGLANRITGKSIFGLFPVKTDSQEKIESFEEKLNKNKPEA